MSAAHRPPRRKTSRRAGPRRRDAGAVAVAERYRTAVVAELRSTLGGRKRPPFTLMRYHLGWQDKHGRAVRARGGKLLRPALCLLCCEAVGGDWRRALPAAAALELLHNFTLIHDDVEDRSRERHGRATLWSLWGEAEAINAGDGMFALAHTALLRLRERGHPPERVLRSAGLLHEATVQLCEGQHRDLLYAGRRRVSRRAYLMMIEGKTAALLAAAGAIGALLGGAGDGVVAALGGYGRRLGLAFQIRDDLLGIWGDASLTGKATGDDLREGKRSYPVVAALERATAAERRILERIRADGRVTHEELARAADLLDGLGVREETHRAARRHAEAAVAQLAGLPLRPARRGELEALARFAAERNA